MNQNTPFQDKLVHKGNWLHFHERHFTINEKPFIWEFVTRPPGDKGGVEIIPIIRYKNQPPELLLIANYRVPLRQFCLEFPAGLVDPKGTLEENAERELKEETGYMATIPKENWLRAHYDPWKSTENCVIMKVFIDGDDARNENPHQHLEADENIKVHRLPLNKNLLEEITIFAEKNNYLVNSMVNSFALGWTLQL